MKKAALGIALALGTVCLTLEVTARLMVFGVKGLDLRRNGIVRRIENRDLFTFETERSIAFEYKPNLDLLRPLNRFQTNSWGMRDGEYPLEKPADTFRAAVMGSSFSLPAGVEIEDAYHSLLEERLSAELAPTTYEFLNFSVGIHLPSQSLAMIRHRALRFDPDLILVSATSVSAPYFLRAWNRRANPKAVDTVPGGIRSVFVAVVKGRLFGRAERPPLQFWGPPDAPTVVEKLGELSRETGIPVVVVRLAFDPTPSTARERVLERRVRENGMFYLDTRSAFRGMDPRQFWILELDPHPNREAHAIFADVLEDFLRRHELVGPREGRPHSR